MPDKKRAFISYARGPVAEGGGEDFANALRKRLEAEEPEITLWQDRTDMEGGVGWWNQITEALDNVEFLIIVMTPRALVSEITRKEWQYARSRGVVVYPVKGVPDAQLDYSAVPQWMSKAHFFDLDWEWDTFVNYLKSPPRLVRVPYMAPDRPTGFVERPEEYGQLLAMLLDPKREDPVAITTALLGAGGFGKTTLATALCHDDRVITAFDDGVLWATLGETPNVQRELTRLYTALTGEGRAFLDEEEAARNLAQALGERSCLIVIDDVWHGADLRPFLRGAKNCARLVTTRRFDVLVEAGCGAARVDVDEMKSSEAVESLVAGIAPPPRDLAPFAALAERLGEWPLLLGLANAALRQRMARGEAIEQAFDYLNTALDKRGVTILNRRDETERRDSVNKTVEVSLELLDEVERTRYVELAVFPEDTDVPLSALGALWGLDAFDAQELAEKLADFSLLKFNLQAGAIRLHDVLREYLAGQLPDAGAVHGRLVDAWDDWADAHDAFRWRWTAYHLVHAGREADLRRRLLDFPWLQAKLDATDPNALVADYDYANDDEELRLVQGAIRLSSHVLAEDTCQLAGQLIGRLLDIDKPGIRPLLHNAQAPTLPWLRPITAGLTQPGGPLLRTFSGHCGWINAVAIAPDGKHAISGSEDCTLTLWDLESGKLIKNLEGHDRGVTAVAIAPDGKHAISASYDQTLKVWDLERGTLIRTLEGHSEGVLSVAIAPGGKHAVSGSWDHTLKLWGLGNGKLIKSLEGHSGGVLSVVIAPDGKRAVSGSSDNTLKLWNIKQGKLTKTLEGHSDGVLSVAIAPDGKRAISGSYDQTLKLWDLEKGTLIKNLEGHSSRITSVAIAPDGKRVVSGSSDNTLKLWDLEKGTLIKDFRGHFGGVNAAAIAPDGKHAISASDDHTLKLWDLERVPLIMTREGHSSRVTSVAIAPDGKRAISGSSDRTLRLWDLENRKLIKNLKGHSGGVNAVAIAPDGKRAISASRDRTLKLWDLEKGTLIKNLEGHSDHVNAVAIAPDGRSAISGSSDQTLKLWDLENGRLFNTLKGHPDWVRAVAIAQGGKRAISGSDDNTLKLWDLENGRLINTLEGHASAVLSVAIAPDGKHAISGSSDNTLKLWDLENGRLINTLEGHAGWVLSVAIAPNGKHAISGSSDNTLKLWDLNTGLCLSDFRGEGAMYACAFSADGEMVLAGGVLGRVHFLKIEE